MKTHLDLARVRRVRVVLKVSVEMPRQDEAVGRLVFADQPCVALRAVHADLVPAATGLWLDDEIRHLGLTDRKDKVDDAARRYRSGAQDDHRGDIPATCVRSVSGSARQLVAEGILDDRFKRTAAYGRMAAWTACTTSAESKDSDPST